MQRIPPTTDHNERGFSYSLPQNCLWNLSTSKPGIQYLRTQSAGGGGEAGIPFFLPQPNQLNRLVWLLPFINLFNFSLSGAVCKRLLIYAKRHSCSELKRLAKWFCVHGCALGALRMRMLLQVLRTAFVKVRDAWSSLGLPSDNTPAPAPAPYLGDESCLCTVSRGSKCSAWLSSCRCFTFLLPVPLTLPNVPGPTCLCHLYECECLGGAA